MNEKREFCMFFHYREVQTNEMIKKKDLWKTKKN
jgi:hypothetical protein